MPYDKIKKAAADHKRYLIQKEQISIRRKEQRRANKPITRNDDPPLKILRNCIKQGYCWWCGKHGWRRLAQHTAMAHGIYAKDIRELAVLLKRAPTCTKEESEIMSDRTLKLLGEGKRKIPDWHLGIGVIHEYSEAGLLSARKHAEYMRDFVNSHNMTEEVRRKAIVALIKVTSRPHPCSVCGKIIPRAKPICCSPECLRKRKQETGVKAAITRKRLANENHEYKLRMSQIPQHQKRKKPHACSICGRIIPKSRPRKYCSPECACNPLQIPIEEIKKMYLGGISSVELSKIYDCCDHTIRRQLKANGIIIRDSHDRPTKP